MTRPTSLLASPKHLIASGTSAVAIILAWHPAVEPASAAHALALGVFGVGLWATGALPEYVTAMAFFLLAMLFKVAPADVVFSGFHSTAFWLVLGGLVAGVAVKRTGLGERIARHLAGSFGTSYPGIIAGLVSVGVALAFLMPSSMGRVVLMIPIATALADHFGFDEGRPGRTGIVLAAVLGCHMPTFTILPANVPNLVLLGAAETLQGVTLMYGRYLLLHFPVLGLLKAVLIVLVIARMFPDKPSPRAETAGLGAMSKDEGRLALLLALALAFWVTDFLHHISPAWIMLAAALVCLLPAVGLVPMAAFNQQLNFGSLLYVAGIMGLGAVVAHSGLGEVLGGGLLAWFPLQPGAAAHNFFSLAAMSSLIGLATTLPGTPAVMTPLADEMARAAGLSVEAVLMTQVLGFSTMLLPYQSAPLVVGMQLGNVPMAAAVKVTLILALMTVLLLLPLDFLWWRLLGWI